MKMPRRAVVSWIGLGLLICSIYGCGGNSTKAYIPKNSAAKDALEKALSTWKSGTAHGTIAGTPAINVFDSRWQAGQKLESYSIGEPIEGQEHPMFKVRLKVEGEEQDEETSFHIVGIDPLLVFRDADFKKATGQ